MTNSQLYFEVHGDHVGTAPLTWAQRAGWNLVYRDLDAARFLHYTRDFLVPQGLNTDDVLCRLRRLVERHDVLRARHPQDASGEPTLSLSAHERFAVEVRHASETEARDCADSMLDELAEQEFDYYSDLPVKLGIVLAEGRPRWVVVVFSRVDFDGWAVRLVEEDLARSLQADPFAGQPSAGDQPPVRTVRPLDQAAFEGSAEGREIGDQSLRHWREQLLHMPRTLLPVPSSQASRDRHWVARFWSTSMTLACEALAVRHRMTTSQVLLCAAAAVLAAGRGCDSCTFGMPVNNRLLDARLLDATINCSQNSICTLLLDRVLFTDVLAQCKQVSLRAYRSARYDPVALEAVAAEVAAIRGIPVDTKTFFHDTRGWRPNSGHRPRVSVSAEELRGHAGKSEFRWEDPRADISDVDLFLYVGGDADVVELSLFVDAWYLEPAEAEVLIRGIETLTIEAACREVGMREVPGLVGASRPAAMAALELIDHCWVDVGLVQRSLASFPTVSAAAVYAVAEPTGGGADSARSLVAYVTPRGAAKLSIEALHQSLVSTLLPERTAMAPHQYVVCATPPATDAEADWARQPAVARGTGRTLVP